MDVKKLGHLKYGIVGFTAATALFASSYRGSMSFGAGAENAHPESAPLVIPRVDPLVSNSISNGDPNVYVGLAKKAMPAVVNIFTYATPRQPRLQPGGPEEFFYHFFGEQMPGGQGGRGEAQRWHGNGRPSNEPQARALGTGFVIDSDGTILTNNHVIDGADEVRVKFSEDESEKQIKAKIIGRDPDLDLAVLKVDRKTTALPLGDSDSLQVGEYVMAIGNPFGQGHSVTHGIISAKGRISPDFPLAKYLQTDAPINPGNSGGPLVNLKGEVIGINNAIDARAQGIGFAIPISSVKEVLSQLRQDGKVSRGYLGVRTETLQPELARKLGVSSDIKGVIVAEAEPGAPAFDAGIRPYDVITEVAGRKVEDPGMLFMAVAGKKAGTEVEVKLHRGKEARSLKVKLGGRPAADNG